MARFRFVVLAALFFVVTVVAPILRSKRTLAFDDYTQNSWDQPGQYTGTSNVNNAVPGQLTLTNTVNQWCNTDNCDAGWASRRPIVLNSDGNRTDYQVHLTIPHEPGMKNDFSDIRFVLENDQTHDLNYYIQNNETTDGDHASVYVKIPNLVSGYNSLYMYYNNANVASLSNCETTMSFCDQFYTEDNSLNTTKWRVDPYGLNTSNFTTQPWLHVNTTVNTSGSLTPKQTQGPNAGQDFVIDRSDPQTVEYAMAVKSTGDADAQAHGIDVNSWSPVGADDVQGIRHSWTGGATDNWRSTAYYRTDAGGENWSAEQTNGVEAFMRFRDQVTSSSAQFQRSNNWTDWSSWDVPNIQQGTATTVNPNIWFADMNANSQIDIQYYTIYKSGTSVTSVIGQEQYQGGTSGWLKSGEIDFGPNAYFGNVTIDYTGTGNVSIAPAGSSTSQAEAGTEQCTQIQTGDNLYTASCVSHGMRYFNYQLYLSSPSDTPDLTVTGVHFEYHNDVAAPTMNSTPTATNIRYNTPIAQGGWFNNADNVEFNWDAAQDEQSGSGVAGYCLYFGADPDGDPVSTSGLIGNFGGPHLQTNQCADATTTTNFNLGQYLSSSLSSGTRYYLNVKSIDNAGNVQTVSSQTNLQFDNVLPQYTTVFSGPSGYISSKIFNFNWITSFPGSDDASGIAGIKYCITNQDVGFQGCDDSTQSWRGLNDSKTYFDDPTNAIPYTDGTVSTTAADASSLVDNGINIVWFILLDNAGNEISTLQGQMNGNSGPILVLTSNQPPTAPTNLSVSPPSNSANSFSFTWQAPATYVGNASRIDYCWTVNVQIANDASNCNWTGRGITQLAQGAYATQQGNNTLYLMAKDEAGNFNVADITSVNFTTNTAAPGNPQNLDISDVSTRATSSWKLALSWSPPEQSTPAVSTYKILRHTDRDSNLTTVGTTSSTNTSFIDTGLTQLYGDNTPITYYYEVRACDTANSCSVSSNIVSKAPTGRFTTPARLTADTDQPKVKDIGTRSATIAWFTDRGSDSKVAFGTSPGHYEPSEIGNSDQTGNHEVALSNLQPGTTYYYIAKWTDQDGNTGTSSERSFTTAPAPVISEVTTNTTSVSDATLNFTSQYAHGVKIYYGVGGGFGLEKNVNTSPNKSSYTINLNGLSDGSKYLVKINPIDSSGNEYQGNIYSFTTPARPVISNLRFSSQQGPNFSKETVTWQTNVPTTTELSYGPLNAKQLETIQSPLTTDHSIAVDGLNDDTVYSLIARSRDGFGNVALSPLQTFKTPLDTTPPTLTSVLTENSIKSGGTDARGQIIVSWKTNKPSYSQVNFGIGQSGPYTSRTSQDTSLVTDHVVVVSDLPVSTIYHLQAVSQDKAGNIGASQPQTVIIGRASDDIFTIIYTALQQIFGVSSK